MKPSVLGLIDLTDNTAKAVASDIRDWRQKLNQLIESRLFNKVLGELTAFLMRVDEKPVTDLTVIEKEQQLIVCSQYHFTVAQLRTELVFYKRKLDRAHKIAVASLMETHRKRIDREQNELILGGARTKGSYKPPTRDELENAVLLNHNQELEAEDQQILEVSAAIETLTNILEDLDARGKILMNLNYSNRSL